MLEVKYTFDKLRMAMCRKNYIEISPTNLKIYEVIKLLFHFQIQIISQNLKIFQQINIMLERQIKQRRVCLTTNVIRFTNAYVYKTVCVCVLKLPTDKPTTFPQYLSRRKTTIRNEIYSNKIESHKLSPYPKNQCFVPKLNYRQLFS